MSYDDFKAMATATDRRQEEAMAAYGQRLKRRASVAGAVTAAMAWAILAAQHWLRGDLFDRFLMSWITLLVVPVALLTITTALVFRLHFKTRQPSIGPGSSRFDHGLYQACHWLTGGLMLLWCLGLALEALLMVFPAWFISTHP